MGEKRDEFTFKVVKKSDQEYFELMVNTASEIHGRTSDNIDWMKWKYYQSPHGDCLVIIALSEDGQLAGEVSFGQYELNDNGKTIRAIYSYQTMVHSNFQKRGLFTTLYKKLVAHAKEKGIDIIFNFPNHNSYEPFLKLNFKPLNSVKYWVAPGNYGKIIKGFSKNSLKGVFKVNPITTYSKELLNDFENLRDNIIVDKFENILFVNKTVEFIKWRYFTYPMFEYGIINTESGNAIVRVGTRGKYDEIQILELFPKNGYSSEFIKAIKKEIKKRYNPATIVINLSDGHPANALMSGSGFYSIPTKIKFCVFPLNEVGNNYLEKKNWAITGTAFHRY
jgi:predicted GNAT family acetyltransferase